MPAPLADYVVVGAGFAGSVLAERLARVANRRVLVVDRRKHIGGNAYDHFDSAGILVHAYGPHVFHTQSRRIYAYLSQFTKWRPYQHRVLASVDGKLVPVPINLDTVNRLYDWDLTSSQLRDHFARVAIRRIPPRNAEEVILAKVGRDLYEKLYHNYTRKQWGREAATLDPQVTARVPVRTDRDDRYFTDRYQVMPLKGYTRLFENMLDHHNISLELNVDYKEVGSGAARSGVIYTGPVDEFFAYRFGALPYRSLRFRHETLDAVRAQAVGVVNYPNEHAYTRVTEFKHLTGQEHPRTSIMYEYPCEAGDPYYPVPCREASYTYQRYAALVENTPGVTFVGRLATYRYYNMDQVVGQALATFERLYRFADFARATAG